MSKIKALFSFQDLSVKAFSLLSLLTNFIVGVVFVSLLSWFSSGQIYLSFIVDYIVRLFGPLDLGNLLSLWSLFCLYFIHSQFISSLSFLVFNNSFGGILWGGAKYRHSNRFLERLANSFSEILFGLGLILVLPYLFGLFRRHHLHHTVINLLLGLDQNVRTSFSSARSWWPFSLGLTLALSLVSIYIPFYGIYSNLSLSPVYFESRIDRKLSTPTLDAKEALNTVNFQKFYAGSIPQTFSEGRLERRIEFRSNRFEFKTSFNQIAPNFEFVPYFDIYRYRGRVRLDPYFLIYDYRNDVVGEFRRVSSFEWKKIVQVSAWANPFFYSRYPNLAPLRGQEISEELYVQDLYRFINDLLSHRSYSMALFRDRFVLARNVLKNYLSPVGDAIIDFYQLEGVSFLRLRQNVPGGFKLGLEQKEYDYSKSTYQETLIPLSPEKSSIYRLSYSTDKNSMESYLRFSSLHLSQAKFLWGSFSTDNKDVLLPRDLYHSSSIIDYLLSEDLSGEQRESIENYVYQYYFRLFRRSFREDLDSLRSISLLSLRRTLRVVGLKQRESDGFFDSDFFRLLNEISSAVESDDKSYFGVN